MKNSRALATVAFNLTLSLMALAATSSVLPAQNNDVTQAELGRFDLFLDNHPDIAQELTKSPSLVNDVNYVESHPALQAFLEDHAQIRESLQANPQAFMKGVANVDAADEPGPGVPSRRPIVTLDNFLDAHPAIAKQLEANPSLINNQNFLKANPDLVTFLKNHPELAEELRANPTTVMKALARFDVFESERSGADAAQVATFDNFLDNHPAIAAELQAHPTLADNAAFIDAHPELKTFLDNHPGIVADLRANPRFFMNQVNHFDRHEARIEQQALNHT